MYTIAFIDRTNISLALSRIGRDLHLDPQQAGTVAGIFFWGYLALQIPGGHLAKHWSAKKFISVLLVLWALFAGSCNIGLAFFWVDFGPLELACDAGRRRFIAVFVAGDLAGIYRGPSFGGSFATRGRAPSAGRDSASRVVCAGRIGKSFLSSRAVAASGVSSGSHLFLFREWADGAVILAAQRH